MHEAFIRRCFELARRGLGQVSPNPMVGAVLVKNGRVIGEGWHAAHGAPHAEPACFANTTEDPTGATLYVNLEPCCHTRKLTPPCVPLVIRKKVARVVISNLDPNPQVAGQGVEQLRAAGIDVMTGILESEGAELNEIFFHRMKTGRPFVHLKTALTLDGFTARDDGSSKWITGEQARADSHWGRLSCDAILVGAETVREDDPALTVRLKDVSVPRQPWRIVLTQTGKLPIKAQVFQDLYCSRTLVVTDLSTQINAAPEAQVIRLSTLKPFPCDEFFQKIQERHIYSLWVEGGAQIHDLFLANKVVQRITLYQSPTIFHSGKKAFVRDLPPLRNVSTMLLGKDHKISGLVDLT